MKLDEVGAVGIVTKQNATKDVPVGGELQSGMLRPVLTKLNAVVKNTHTKFKQP